MTIQKNAMVSNEQELAHHDHSLEHGRESEMNRKRHQEKERAYFVSQLTEGIATIAGAFWPRPVILVKKVRNEMGLTNLKVMIPFCRTTDEGQRVLEILAQAGLSSGLSQYLFSPFR